MTTSAPVPADPTAATTPDHISDLLRWAAGRLREAGVPATPVVELDRLAEQVQHPCVVAVVGRVKAGKSTFVNALLGDDLARVGTTETTATINYFRYGTPDSSRPVRCHWRTGHVTIETRAFLDRLQGNDIETLRLAADIDHLEYLVPNPYLEHVTLVDTPGLAAVVDEHQERTAEFLNLRDQLRDRQHAETQRLGGEADAVIYVLGSIARTTDACFLEGFRELSGGASRAINALGVLARIDVQPHVLHRRHELASRISRQLEREINAVFPVSAGLQRALDQLGQAWLQRCTRGLLSIPASTRAKLLDSEDFYLGLQPPDCPLGIEERAELRGDLPWGVFATIGRVISDVGPEPERVAAELRAIAGFDPLRRTLDRVFFQRGRHLRTYRVLRDARRLLSGITYDLLPNAQLLALERGRKYERLQRLIAALPAGLDDRSELEELVRAHFAPFPDLATVVTEIDRALACSFHALEQHYADFRSLEHLEREPDAFSDAERDELRALFGLYGSDLDRRLGAGWTHDHLDERQQHWSDLEIRDLRAIRRDVAAQAASRYGILLRELSSVSEAAHACSGDCINVREEEDRRSVGVLG